MDINITVFALFRKDLGDPKLLTSTVYSRGSLLLCKFFNLISKLALPSILPCNAINNCRFPLSTFHLVLLSSTQIHCCV